MTPLLLAQAMALTNLVGHVVVATPLAIEGDRVVVATASATNRYPLSVFPASEQRRVRERLGLVQPPASAAEADRRAYVRRESERIAAMERDGLLKADEAAARRKALRAFAEKAAKTPSAR